MTHQPQISVIVPHFNDLSRLDQCLEALCRQTIERDRFEIIVADNGPPSGRAEVDAAIAGRARLADAPIPGAGPARNAGVALSRGEILAFTDCDCIPAPGWLTAGVAALDAADLVGGGMKVLVADEGRMTGTEAFETIFAFNNRRYVEEEHFTITANLLCTRALFDAIGPFRTGVSEDKEWCLRAHDKGYRIGYADDAIVSHPARHDWKQLRGKWERLMAESYVLANERGGGGSAWLLRTWALLPSIPIHAVRILTTGMLSGFAPRLAALAILVRLRLWRFAEGHRLLLRGKE